jgi:hypothetical protein
VHVICVLEETMNITLSADETTIRRARDAARKRGKSLNQVIREVLDGLAGKEDGDDPVGRLFALMDAGRGSLRGRRWTRDEAHE